VIELAALALDLNHAQTLPLTVMARPEGSGPPIRRAIRLCADTVLSCACSGSNSNSALRCHCRTWGVRGSMAIAAALVYAGLKSRRRD
jgi:hypothetical protein